MEPSFAKGGNPGKPGGEDPPPPPPPADTGRVRVLVGYPAVVNQTAPTGTIAGYKSTGLVPVGTAVDVPMVMDIAYFSSSSVGTAGELCFPDQLVRGDIALTEEGGNGRADYTFTARARGNPLPYPFGRINCWNGG